MSEDINPIDHQDPRLEALQAAYDRVNSWEETAPPEKIRAELDDAIARAGVEVSEETRDKLVQHINDGGGREDVAGIVSD
jgi:hypothetical protein